MKNFIKTIFVGAVIAAFGIASVASSAGSVPNASNYFSKNIHVVNFSDTTDQFGDANHRLKGVYVNSLNSLGGNVGATNLNVGQTANVGTNSPYGGSLSVWQYDNGGDAMPFITGGGYYFQSMDGSVSAHFGNGNFSNNYANLTITSNGSSSQLQENSGDFHIYGSGEKVSFGYAAPVIINTDGIHDSIVANSYSAGGYATSTIKGGTPNDIMSTIGGKLQINSSYQETETATTTLFGYTGSVASWTIPSNVSGTITILIKGASGGLSDGGGSRGHGGYAQGVLTLASSTPGAVVYFNIGQAANAATGGYGGGGNAHTHAGGGGGASWVSFQNTFSTSTVALVGAGGGGAGPNGAPGGDGGMLTGSDGGGANHGTGGTQTAGGSGGSGGCCNNNGTAGSAYQGGTGSSDDSGAGGGSGYFGGGGAGVNSGGGGGSSFVQVNLTAASTSVLATFGDGSIQFSYDLVNGADEGVPSLAVGGSKRATAQIGSASSPGCLALGSASGTPATLIWVYFDTNAAMYTATTKPSFCE